MLEKLINLNRSEKGSYFRRRIVAEMKFALLLSQKLQGKYDDIIRRAEDYLSEAAGQQGIITEEMMINAEKLLAPISEAAKEYELMCAAHAHIDMNWQWGWDETVKVVLDTTKSILQIMEEYPEFKFSQSQASVYRILEEYAPELLETVKQRVHEGRWEVSASTWVEADKNMPSGESAARQILYAKRYLSRLLDISMDDIVLDFEPDTFGHSAHVPEILRNANIKYYYHCRGMKDCAYQVYVWRAPSGAEILVNRERNFYFVDVNPDMALHAFSNTELTGLRKTLHVYGVGDHGGGPTRRDVERLLDMNRWPVFPKFTLVTYREFFEAMEEHRSQLPVYEGEINGIFDGCYTSQSRNKNGNRRSEELMYKTELFSAISALWGKDYPHAKLEETWRKVLLNQFHDIVTGSGVRATREYALGMYQEVRASADSLRSGAYDYIAERIDTGQIVGADETAKNLPDLARAYGAGVGSGQVERGSGNTRIFHVFNPTSQERTQTMEMLLWEWYGDPKRLSVTDAQGKPVKHQILKSGYNNYWYHNYMKLLIMPTVPGFGYTTIKMTEGPLDKIPVMFHWERRQQEREQLVLENDLLRVTFDQYDASILSVLDKETGEELADTGKKGGIFQYIVEANCRGVNDWRTEMSSWFTGRFKTIESVNQDLELQVNDGTPEHMIGEYDWREIERPREEKGELRSTLSYTAHFQHSSLRVEIALDAGSRSLNYKVSCDWHEIGNLEKGVPRLQFVMPLPYSTSSYTQDIPFGLICREEKGTDTSALSFTAAFKEDGSRGIAVSSRNTYGYRCEDDSIALALLRSSFDPDPYPENGICDSEFCVSFIQGRPTEAELLRYFQEYNCPMDILSGGRHEGTLPLHQSCLKAEMGSVMISSVKMAEDSGELVIRLYEAEGRTQNVTLDLGREIQSACKTDLLEREMEMVETDGTKAATVMKPHEIAAVKIKFS